MWVWVLGVWDGGQDRMSFCGLWGSEVVEEQRNSKYEIESIDWLS